MKKILIMLASCKQDENDETPKGRWLKELIYPYRMLRRAGYSVFVAVPHSATSFGERILESMRANTPEEFRQGNDPGLDHLFQAEDVANWSFDALFCAGNHTTSTDPKEICAKSELLSRMLDTGKVIGAVSYGPAALLDAVRCDGHPLVFRRNVTGLSNIEAEEFAIDDFRLEDRLREAGANYHSGKPWEPYVIVDGNLVTGQNPGSAGTVVEAMIKLLKNS